MCVEAIGPFLLGEDLERNSSQELTKSYQMQPSHAAKETVQISPEAASIICTSSGTQ